MLHVVESKKTYSSSDVTKKLGISSSMLRKYNFNLSKVGISFQKERGKLVYTSEDIRLFKRLLDLHQQTGTTLQEVVKQIGEEYRSSRVENVAEPVVEPVDETVTTPVTTVTDREQMQMEMAASLVEVENKFLNEFKKMDEKLDQMKNYIDGRLQKRDDQLVQAMRDIQQLKKAEQQRGFINWLKRLFKKNK